MKSSVATFAAGCFWHVEEVFRTIPGVTTTQVGYTGGSTSYPTYEQVCSGTTGHAEAVQVTFDPERVTYQTLLNAFWKEHDPTTLNRQGPDIGSEYRSVIFYHNEQQRTLAEVSKDALEQSHAYTKTIVTEIVPATIFYPAEDYHQHYLLKRGLSNCPI